MKVLIAGADGYIGSVLAKTLPHQVTLFDIKRGMDVTDHDLWAAACTEMEAVIYLAGITNNDECEKNPGLARAVNQDCFPSVMNTALQKGVRRFIYASSVAAYGSSNEELDEKCPLLPTTLYGKGKAFCDLHVRENGGIVTRSASVCGMSPWMRRDLTINKMVFDALKHNLITVNGGTQYRCHIYILDLCDFYALLLEAAAEKVGGQAFNVVECNESIRDTAINVAMIADAQLKFGPSTDDRSYQASGRKALEVFAWKPQRHYTNAVSEMLKYYA